MMKTSDTRILNLDSGRWLRHLIVFCLSFEIALVLLDILFYWQGWAPSGPLRNIFHMGREDSLAAWFSATQTLMVGLTLGAIGLISAQEEGQKTRARRGWFGLAVFFLFLAMDDAIILHERLGPAFRDLLTGPSSGPVSRGLPARLVNAFPSYSWQLLYGPLLLAAGILMLRFLFRKIEDVRGRGLILIALFCLIFAIELDFIEGLEGQARQNFDGWLVYKLGLSPRLFDHFQKIVEEFVEMLGMTLFWVAFLRHLGTLAPNGLSFLPKKRDRLQH